MASKVISWRRIDEFPGEETLRLDARGDRIRVVSELTSSEGGAAKITHKWELTGDWRAQSLHIAKTVAGKTQEVLLERDGEGWRVDGNPRPDLDGALEPDFSVTPFCNTLIMRRVPMEEGASLTVDIAYIDGADLSMVRSRQRYEYKKPGLYRYIDLGVAKGFEADLAVDEEKLVIHYEHLFKRIR